MVSRSAKKFLPRLKLRLGTKAVACAVLLISVNTALVVSSAYWSLTSEFGERARRDIEVNLRTLALSFAETFGDAKVTMKDGTVTRVEIPRMPEFTDHAIVDRLTVASGGTAALSDTPGGGLTVVIELPLARRERAQRRGIHLSSGGAGQPDPASQQRWQRRSGRLAGPDYPPTDHD